MEKYFSREFELSSTQTTLEILQHTYGDVGCVVWDAALVLAAYLDNMNQRNKNIYQGTNFLELGAGTGCVGLAAAALGGNCIITDLPSMVPLIKRNVKKNENSLKGNVEIKPFEWGTDLQLLYSTTEKEFETILVADCIYYKESLDSLIQTLLSLLKRPSSDRKVEAYVSYEERESEEKRRLVEKFLFEIKKECNVTRIPVADYREDFQCDDIHILRLTIH